MRAEFGETNGLAGVAAERGTGETRFRGRIGGGQAKEFFDAHFEGVSQAKRDFGVGDEGTGLDGVDALATDAGGAGEIGRGDAALLADESKPVLDRRVHFKNVP